MLRATAGCRLLMKTVKGLGGCNGGKVIFDVEAVSHRGVIDRRLLADVDTGLGLITWVRKCFSLTQCRTTSPDIKLRVAVINN